MTITKIVTEINKRLLELNEQYADTSEAISTYKYLGDHKRFEAACDKRTEISHEISILKDMLRATK